MKKFFSVKTVYNLWRVDKELYERKLKFMFITYYKYAVRKIEKHIVYYRLRKYPNPTYFKEPVITKHYMGRKEFMEECNGSKLLVPINRTLDLDRP